MAGSRGALGSWCALAAALCGCGFEANAPPSSGPPHVEVPTDWSGTGLPSAVLGIESDFEGSVGSVRVTIVLSGAEVRDELVVLGAAGAAFPLEISVPPIGSGQRIDARLEACASADGSGDPLVTRLASTVARDGRVLLVRVRLENECSGEAAPGCGSPNTCIAGLCQASYRPPEMLADYHLGWAEPFADACKGLGAGPPAIAIGQGQDGFEVVEPDGEMAFEVGAQGGYHVWLALSMKNLHQEGATTFLSAHSEDFDAELQAWTSPLPYEPNGDGCELAGVRYQLFFDDPSIGVDDAELAGTQVRFRATVLDAIGDAASEELVVRLSELD